VEILHPEHRLWHQGAQSLSNHLYFLLILQRRFICKSAVYKRISFASELYFVAKELTTLLGDEKISKAENNLLAGQLSSGKR